MFVLRLYVALAKLNVCLKKQNWRHGKEPVNLRDLQDARKCLSEHAKDLTQSVNLDSTRYLVNLDSLLEGVDLNPAAKYHRSTIDLANKLVIEYLELVHTLYHDFSHAHNQLMQYFLEKGDTTLLWMLDDLSNIKSQAACVNFTEKDFKLFLEDDKLLSLKKCFAHYIYNHWNTLVERLAVVSIKPDFLRSLANHPEIKQATLVLLDVPVRLQTLFKNIIAFDGNINELNNENLWYLSSMIEDMQKHSELFFKHAKTRQAAFNAIVELDELSLQLDKGNLLIRNWYAAEIASDKKRIPQLRAVLIDVLSMQNLQVVADFKPFQFLDAKLFLQRLQRMNQEFNQTPAMQIGFYRRSNPILIARATGTCDSIILRSSDSAINANLFTLPDFLGQDELSEEGMEDLHPELQNIIRQRRREDRANKKAEAELEYINLPNRHNLGLFYHTFITQVETCFIGCKAVASGMIQQSHTVDSSVGVVFNVLGEALGSFGGIIFTLVGHFVINSVQLQQKNRARNVADLGPQNKVFEIMERIARKLTLEYELQIRLLKSAEVNLEEQRRQKESTNSDGKSTKFESSSSLFSSGNKLLRKHKILNSHIEPAQMAAEYAVALIVANILLADIVPTMAELEQFCCNALRESPLSRLQNENKIFDELNFYRFNVHNQPRKWHASEMFRKPHIAISKENGDIQYWGPDGDKNNSHFWRLGTVEEAQHAGYVLMHTQVTAATSSVRMASK